MVEIVRGVKQVGEHAVREKAGGAASVGSPEAEKETGCGVPETSVALTVVELAPPWLTTMSAGLVREKSKGAGFTVNLKSVVRRSCPALPATVMV